MDLTSRKFWIAVFLLAITTILCYIGKIDGTQFVAGITAIFTFYSAGNVLDKVVGGSNG